MQEAASSCEALDTLIFAEPKRIENRTWQKLLMDERVIFRPVKRVADGKPVDSAIIDMLESFIASAASRIALLTSDRDFVPFVSRACANGKQVLVLVTEARIHVADLYRKAQAEVHVLKADKPQVTRSKPSCFQEGRERYESLPRFRESIAQKCSRLSNVN
ncbi:unnamed protein product [Symbiodinium sp. CCMP2456]|nr:unnamed protein product [Symbiodinium sp. CCMP2456]